MEGIKQGEEAKTRENVGMNGRNSNVGEGINW